MNIIATEVKNESAKVKFEKDPKRIAGDACKFIEQIGPQLEGKWVGILARVSTVQQGKKGNLETQVYEVRKAVEGLGGIVKIVWEREYSGRCIEWLKQLADIAAEAFDKGIQYIVAVSACRFVRNELYRSDISSLAKLKATEEQLQEVHSTFYNPFNIKLATVAHPNASLNEVRSMSTKWGVIHKGSKKRKLDSYRKPRREAAIKRIVDMISYGMKRSRIVKVISRQFSVPLKTCYQWFQQAQVCLEGM